MGRIDDLLAEAKNHFSEVYNTLDKGSTGRNIRHDKNALISTINRAFPATAHDPQRASMDDLLAFGGVGTGTFIGKNALTWDAKAAKKAAGLLKRGIDPEKVWQRHMTGQMPDGALFQEIDDSAARIGNAFMKDKPISWTAKDLIRENPERPNLSIGNLMSHDKLYSSYPELSNTGVEFKGNTGGSMSNPKLGQTNYQMSLGELEKGVRVPLHELQHAIQDREGWALGGNPNMISESDFSPNFLKEISAYKSVLGVNPYAENSIKNLTNKAKIDAYYRLTGEAQARATQSRLNMDMAKRRENYPLKYGRIEGIPLNDLIYKYDSNSPNLSLSLPETSFSKAHEIARKNAMLPVEQGGLGLPENNTAFDRARAMGFDVDNPVYHGTNADISEFDLKHSGKASGAEQYGSGVYTTTSPQQASGYANNGKDGGNVLSLLVNMKNPIIDGVDGQLTKPQIKSILQKSPDLENALWNYGDVSYEGKGKVFNTAVNSAHEYQGDKLLENLHPLANDFYSGEPQAFNDAVAKVLKKDGVQVNFENGEKYKIPFNPKQVRSRFAAFDPLKKNSTNILASLLAGTALINDKKGEKK
jgi:ADP-Ribosyltransferase in polyvalent proteins